MAEIIKTPVFCDLSRGYFVSGRYSRQATQQPFEQFFSKNTLYLDVYPLVVNPVAVTTQDPFNVVDVSGLSLVASIYDSTGATVLATQSTFTSDVGQSKLSGAIDCNTVEMAAAVTADPTSVIIEFRFTGSVGSKNVRATSSIRKQYNTTGSPTPVASDVYLTEKQSKALFVPREGAVGDNFSMLSVDGTKKYLVYIDNDGTLKTTPIS